MSDVPAGRLAGFYDAIFRCESAETLDRNVLRPLASLFEASSVSIFCYSGQSGMMNVSRSVVHAIDPESVASYSRNLYRQDPIFAVAENIINRSARRNHVIQYRDATVQYGISDNYHSFLKGINIGDVMTSIFPVAHLGKDIVNLGIHRRPGEAPFGTREFDLLKQLNSALACVVSNSIRLDSLEICQTLLRSAGETLGAPGVVAIREDGTVCHSTPVGLDYFRSLVASHFADDAHALSRAVRRELGRTEAGSIEIRFGFMTLGVHRLARDSQGDRTLLLLKTDGDEHFLERCRSGRLSARETEITRLIGAGLSDKAISNQLLISTRTAQNHVRSIFRKMQVNSRTQLLSRLAH